MSSSILFILAGSKSYSLTILVDTEWLHTGPGGDGHSVVGPGHPQLPRHPPLRGVGVQLIDWGEVADQWVGVNIATWK